MRKMILVLGLLMVFLLAGCAKQYVCSDGKTVSDPSMCVVEVKEEPKPEPVNPINNLPVTPVVPVEEVKPVVKEIDVAIQKLFDKAKISTNYAYDYTAPKNLEVVKVYVLDNDMKLFLGKRPEMLGNFEYTDAFFENDKKSVVLMCLQVGSCDDTTAALKSDYDTLHVKTVMEVIDEVVYAKISGDEMLNGKYAHVVDYKLLSGEEGTMWVDKWFGTPMKKTFTKNGEKVSETYFNFDTGVVKESDVTVPGNAVFR